MSESEPPARKAPERKRGKLGLPQFKPQCPIYPPGDPRIQETLNRGAGVGVDYSQVTGRTPSAAPAFSQPPKHRDVLSEAERQLLPDNERYPQEDEDDSS